MSQFAVQIEELVLDGFDMTPAQGRRLARLTEARLARLLDQRGASSRMSSCTQRDAPGQQVDVAADARPERMAEQIAEALYRALDRKS